MLTQTLLPDRPRGAKGLLAVARPVALVLADAVLVRALQPLVGEVPGSILFWVLGLLIAWLTLRLDIMGYRYVLTGSMLRVSCLYGRYERLLAIAYLNTVTFIGSPEDAKQRHSSARTTRAVPRKSAAEPLAVVYREDGRAAILLIAPDEALRSALMKRR